MKERAERTITPATKTAAKIAEGIVVTEKLKDYGYANAQRLKPSVNASWSFPETARNAEAKPDTETVFDTSATVRSANNYWRLIIGGRPFCCNLRSAFMFQTSPPPRSKRSDLFYVVPTRCPGGGRLDEIETRPHEPVNQTAIAVHGCYFDFYPGPDRDAR